MKLTTRLMQEEGDNGGGGGTILSGGNNTPPPSPPPSNTPDNTPPPNSGSWDFRSVLDESGAFKQGWHEALPDDLKPYAGSLGKYPNVTELLRGLGNAQKLIGQRGNQSLKPPGADATPEQLAEWRKVIGVPDDPNGYGIKKPDQLPEGVDWNDEEAAAFGKLAHELNLTPAQAQKLMEYDLARSGKMVSSSQAKIESFIKEQREALQKEWGDKFQNNVSRALKAAELLGLDPKDAEIGNSAKMIKALAAAAELMTEDKFVGSDKVGLGLTGADQAEDIRRNPANPWHNAYHGKEGKDRQKQAAALIARLNGVKLDG